MPHGLANAVIMPYVLEMYGKKIYGKLHKLAVAAGVSTKNTPYKESAEKFIGAIKELNKNMNIPDKLDGIKKEDISLMAAHADKEANPLYPVPVLMNKNELEKIYYKVADFK